MTQLRILCICSLLPGLQVFSISGNWDMEQALVPLFRLRHLRHLSFPCRRAIPHEVFSAFASVDLRYLDLGNVILDGYSMQKLLALAPALRLHKTFYFRSDEYSVWPRRRSTLEVSTYNIWTSLVWSMKLQTNSRYVDTCVSVCG